MIIIYNLIKGLIIIDAFGNNVGLTQGAPLPSILGIGQTTIFKIR
jgi:hypothetical protein